MGSCHCSLSLLRQSDYKDDKNLLDLVTACWGQFKVPKGTKEIQGCHRITVIFKRTVENWKEAATFTLHLELHLPVCLGTQPILGQIQSLTSPHPCLLHSPHKRWIIKTSGSLHVFHTPLSRWGCFTQFAMWFC